MDQLVVTIDKYNSHHLIEIDQRNDERNFNNDLFHPLSISHGF